jgi:hypothetical protein
VTHVDSCDDACDTSTHAHFMSLDVTLLFAASCLLPLASCLLAVKRRAFDCGQGKIKVNVNR